MICLPKPISDKLKIALKNGELPLAKLYDMTSEERHTMFSHYVGNNFAEVINTEFEKAIVSKQNNALKKWVERTFDPKRPEIKNKAIAKIERVRELLTPEKSKDFLRDLVSTKIGVDISAEEAQTLGKLYDDMQQKKAAIDRNSPRGSESRLAYGYSLEAMKNYVGELTLKDRTMSIKEYLKNPQEIAYALGGAAKSVVSSLDNSFFGRQGIKTLLNITTAPTWAKSFAQSWVNIGKQLISGNDFINREGGSLNVNWKKLFANQSDAVLSAIKADIYSRENALNGKYNAARNGYGLGVSTEEAFPTSVPERIPILGRLFKASEAAFNGGALRMRADLADAMIANAENNGVDMLDRNEASSHAKLVTSMTGRGDIGKAEALGREINALMFSIKFLKSNIDTLTAHQFDPSMTPAAKKQAAWATARIIMSIAALMGIAYAIDPDSVDFDPRSTRFGKIKFKNRTFDITGGMASLVTLAARLVPTVHDGKFGFWTKNKKGEYTQLAVGKYGEATPGSILGDFFAGKLAPLPALLRDVWRGEDFQGNKPTVTSAISGLVTPLPFSTYLQLQDAGSAEGLATLILEGLGFSSSEVQPTQTEQEKEGMGNLVDLSIAYAKAFNIDPQNAMKALFTTEQLGEVEGNLVELQRFFGKDFAGPGGSENYVKKQLEKMGIPWEDRDKYNLEHIVPHAAGGDNSPGNLQIISRELHKSYTRFDTALAKAVKGGTMTREEAEALSLQYKVSKTLTAAEALSLIK